MKRTLSILTLATLILSGAPALADGDEWVAEAAAVASAHGLDTTGSPYAITNAISAQSLWCRDGQNVAIVSPSGATSTLTPTDGACSWTPTEGGLWTLTNPAEGEALFTVRHGLFGTQGTGSAANPVKIVDADELSNLYASGGISGYGNFTLCGAPGLIDALVVPQGFYAAQVGAGYQLIPNPTDGSVYASPATYAAFLDTRWKGDPANRTRRADANAPAVPVAYSGDNWSGAVPAAASTLTVTAPDGTATVHPLTGTGTTPLRFASCGDWTLALASASGDLFATVVVPGGTTLYIR